MIDIDKNLELFYEREENKEDTYIGAISKHECVVDGSFVIELLEEVKRLRDKLDLIRNTVLYDIEENFTEKQAHDPVIIDIMKKIYEVIE